MIKTLCNIQQLSCLGDKLHSGFLQEARPLYKDTAKLPGLGTCAINSITFTMHIRYTGNQPASV